MRSRSDRDIDIDWECPRRGLLVAYKAGHAVGLITRTAAGFEAVDARSRLIGTFDDFAQAEERLARLRDRHTDHDSSSGMSPTIAILTTALLASFAAIATIASVTN